MIDRAIYHITHVSNLPSIIGADCLWSDAQRVKQGFKCTNIGYLHIKERRLKRNVPVAMRGKLGDYVPFNFCSRSVMLYIVSKSHGDYSGGQESIIHLVSSVKRVIESGRPWAFTDRHADLAYARYSDNTVHLNRIDWGVMPQQFWGGDSELKEKRQAEFLVHDWFPWSCVVAIGVHNQTVAKQVRTMLSASKHKPEVVVKQSWYYP